MSITSSSICAAADQLQGFVGFNRKTSAYIVRFCEDAFGMDIPDDSITPTHEFVWQALTGGVMQLKRERLQMLLDLHLDDRINITEPLRVYLSREDLPEISAERHICKSNG